MVANNNPFGFLNIFAKWVSDGKVIAEKITNKELEHIYR